MFKGLPEKGSPFNPRLVRFTLKLTAGVLLLSFFLNYQPTFGFPPLRKAQVYAQETQTQTVNSNALPFAFQLPHPGYLTTQFSAWHPGIDIPTGLGMPIKPIAEGIVSNTGFGLFGYGTFVEIDHGHGYKSFYAHLGKMYVQKGQKVAQADVLGEVGLTGNTSGPHTHLEVIRDGVKIDPLTILPEIRKYPQSEDFKVYGSATSSAQVKKTYTGGTTKTPTLGQTTPKVSPAPSVAPTPKVATPPTVVDKMDVTQILAPSTNSKPNFLSL